MGAVTSPLPSTLDSDMRGFLPNDTPLAMTPSQLWELQPAARHPTSAARIIWLRRVLIFTGTVALTAAGGYEMYEVLQVGGVTILEGMQTPLTRAIAGLVAFCDSRNRSA